MISTIIVGDWSYDGHNQTTQFTIEEKILNKENRSLDYYYNLAVEAGAPNIKEWFDEYENDTISIDEYDALIKKYPDLSLSVDVWDFEAVFDPRAYAELWVYIVNQGIKLDPDSSGSVSIINPPNYNIGGYGLF